MVAKSDPLPAAPKSRKKMFISIGVLMVLMFGYWFVFQRPAGTVASGAATSAPSQAPNKFGPEIVDEARLLGLPKEVGHPVYWAGRIANTETELTIAADGSVGIRYLPPDSPTKTRTLTLGTFPNADAFKSAQEAAKNPGGHTQTLPSGAIVGWNDTNVFTGYLAVDGMPFVIQVFDPKKGVAKDMLTAGQVVPISG